MPSKKISEMDPVVELTSETIIPCVQEEDNFSFTIEKLTDYVLPEDLVHSGDPISSLTNDSGYQTDALESGDNVSELTNDSDYLPSGSDISDLTNNIGYQTAGEVSSAIGGYLSGYSTPGSTVVFPSNPSGLSYSNGTGLSIDSSITTNGTGTLTAVAVVGDGAGLTGIDADQIGSVPSGLLRGVSGAIDTVPFVSAGSEGSITIANVNDNEMLLLLAVITGRTEDIMQTKVINEVVQKIDGSGNLTAASLHADNGFTGTGTYTTFSIVDGIITAAS